MSVTLTDAQRARLDESQDFWLATVRPAPAAHLVPIWAVRVGGELWMGTEADSQKVRNLRAHPRAALALPDTRDVLILEGHCSLHEGAIPATVRAAFRDKYDWTLGDEVALLRFLPDKVIGWHSDAT